MSIYKLSLIVSLILFNLNEYNFQGLSCTYGNANIANDPRIASLYNTVVNNYFFPIFSNFSLNHVIKRSFDRFRTIELQISFHFAQEVSEIF
jgi:hypothetical protein